MLAAAARRFFVLFAAVSLGTSLLSVALGALAGAAVERSISLGLYLVGSFLLIGGFFVGNRGPLRSIGDRGLFSAFGRKGVRPATSEERREEVNASVVYITVGLLLIVVGVAVDSRSSLW